MAISQSHILTIDNANASTSRSFSKTDIAQTGSGFDAHVQEIGTVEETYSGPAGIGVDGVVIIKNLDGSNYVDVGFATGVYGFRINAGESLSGRLVPNATLYLKANTAACDIEILLGEN